MAEPVLVERQQAVLRDLVALAARRRAAGERADREHQAAIYEADQARERRLAEIAAAFAAARDRVERESGEARRQLENWFASSHDQSRDQFEHLKTQASEKYSAIRTRSKRETQEARWETQTAYEATRHTPRREFKELEKQIEARLAHFRGVVDQAYQWLAEVRQGRPRAELPDWNAEPVVDSTPLEEPGKKLNEGIAQAEQQLAQLRGLWLPSLFKGATPVLAALVVAGLVAVAAGGPAGWNPLVVGGGAVVGLAAALGGLVWLSRVARAQVARGFAPFEEQMLAVERLAHRWLSLADAHCRLRQAEMKQKFEHELKRLSDQHDRLVAEARQARDAELAQLEAKYAGPLAEARRVFEEGQRQVESNAPGRLAEMERKRDEAVAATEAECAARKAAADAAHRAAWDAIAADWQASLAAIRGTIDEVNAACAERFPAWDDPRWEGWQPDGSRSEVIPFGRFEIPVASLPGVADVKDRLDLEPPQDFSLPAMLSFPERCSVVIKTGGQGRVEAVQVLQDMMLRFLCAVPPGKVRYTIVDPVGLGQNFAGFMHLADYDEKLVSSRIWTEPQFIEQRLADLTAHMSNVIQKYLRNEYETIDDYNRHAGEVAEPFRVLVVANFPFNFTDAAARHLLSIATSGARCGVYTLISVDMKQRMPQGFNLADLEQHAVRLTWKDQRFVWRESGWEGMPLEIEAPPTNERLTHILHAAGEAARHGSRVEVPFEFVAPPPERWWQADSRAGIDVALGRAGATKRQALQLGRGTSQHVLIAGKTGSGKSSLLHALITNVAVTYAPDEVELYLIDFKKGVEFKTYAAWALPHARVVAIESEREFGLSVLERLDQELKLRGDAFRDAGVQDIEAYRDATGRKLPRILLVVDEFQEFFVEDDKVAQEASLLFDRLVRQGRAFGIHVHLGSQTLGGAYSLARSTLGQMAVRIALQCSEADAHLILSEDNPAARLLTRPGEAIYNDANGRVEGNHLFQVVWLPDERKDDYLRRVGELAAARGYRPPQPQIVFEGNAPADLTKNGPLTERLEAADWPAPEPVGRCWLGEAISIKDPTSVAFRRQSGSHLLLIGQQAESALSILTLSVVGLAAQHPPEGPQTAEFYLLDGMPADALHAGYLGKLAAALPHRVEVAPAREAGRIVGELARRLAERQESPDAAAVPIYLVVFDLARFRDLRKSDDDFSFSREEKPNPAKQFATLLREGPALGIHVLVWCDTWNNLTRSLDRGALREFEQRVLFQMNQADSSNLIDSPAASKLGMHRALLASEEEGKLEKFRPYRLPEVEWLAALAHRWAARPRANAAAAAPTSAPGKTV